MADDTIDLDPPTEQADATGQADVTGTVAKIASLNGRAVMPNGLLLGRGEILATLGLNPNTSPTAWLNVLGCGSNASALLPGDLQRIAVNRLANASTVLRRMQEVGGGAAQGFASGGDAPTK